MIQKILVLFKTHLDMGFTNYAHTVVENYMKVYIPGALKTAREMRGEDERFIWTTGSWMIDRFLEESKDSALLEEAIRNGDIRWHGLPFTTHTELMDAELFRYGLRISQGLDARFGVNTIAAKMTDVPGHTKAMIPHMAEAGIKFLHIGVNPASKRPEVPRLFRWKGSAESEIIVMYNDSYGELTEIGESGTAVYFAHTGDNLGPQPPEEIRRIYKNLHAKYPEAVLRAGTLEDVAKIALMENNLPVIASEIGDTWIHGAGTDPKKMSCYRALLRLKEQLPKEQKDAVCKELLLVPEHTWGLDEKVWLGKKEPSGDYCGEHEYFVRKDFEQARGTEKFQAMESSWKEQRAYVENAALAVTGSFKKQAESAMSEYKRGPWDISGFEKVDVETELTIAGWSVRLNKQGAICGLERNGLTIADEAHPLGAFQYEVFSRDEYKGFLDSYKISDENWAKEDFDKIGMEKAIQKYHCYYPEVNGVYRKENCVVVKMTLPRETLALYGGMKELELCVHFFADTVKFDFAWFGKYASRIAEGSWLQFSPVGRVRAVQKMGEYISPSDVVCCGNNRLHAVWDSVQIGKFQLETMDAPLVSIGEPSLLRFEKTLPCLDNGVFVNLHNNIWGTNFPMWYDENARFRFTIAVV